MTILISSVMEVILDDGLQCPCVTTEMAKSACGVYNSTESTELCVSRTNYLYSVLFMTAPAVVLFLLASLGSYKWEGCVGYCCVKPEAPCVTCRCFCHGFLIALLAPISWIAAAFVDGNFYACASTPLPYNLPHAICSKVSCCLQANLFPT